MKIRIGKWNIGKFQNSYLSRHSSGTVKFAVRYSLAVRLLTVLLITGLLIPLIFFGQNSNTSVQNSTSDNRLSTSVFASAESVVSSALGSFGSLVDPVFSSATSVNQSVAKGYQAVSNYLTIPTPPEGFAQAKVPTLWDKVSGDVSSIASSVVSPFVTSSASAAPGVGKFSFDTDNKADAARWQASTGEWKVKSSYDGSISTVMQATSSTTIMAPADYTGDGKTDYAVLNYSTGTWTIKPSSGGATQTITGLGQYGDKIVSGKYESGDSLADAAVFRPSNGTWYVKQSSTGTVVSTAFGASTDIPTPGDYDGDGLMDYAVFRPSDSGFYVKYSSNGGVVFFQWGISTDTPVPADYDGDNKTDFAVYRSSTGTWYVNRSNGSPYIWKTWGNYGDQPAPADYDGDGKDDFAVWRPTTGVWYIVKSSVTTLDSYEYQTLGVAGDVPVSSVHIKQIGGPVPAYGMAKARLSPRNATGGTNLYSQNFSWGTSLVSLPGRAGLDAGFGISYNSLVWTKQFGTMIFDADNSNISPGFRFGFPVIEPSYFDDQTGKFAYLMVTPSGGRSEFRQIGASSVYETGDSSYTQLKVNTPLGGGTEDSTLTVTGTNGSQMTYVWKAGAFRCSQIKDRNGNFIAINHDQYGLLQSVTDTLGRTISVNYDSQYYPISITQNWQANNGSGSTTPHTYATFTYMNITISTNFGSLGVYGPPNGTTLKVLQKIERTDQSYTTFEYNGYGQVHKIADYAKDNSFLNQVRTDLGELGTGTQTDCPRFTKTYNKAANFNLDTATPPQPQETIIRNSYTENQTCSIGGLNLPTTRTEVWMDNHPNNHVSKTCHFPAGNWAEGLAYATEDIADNAQKRWSITSWTQDNTSLNYILNPRVTETKVGDEANVKRTSMSYLMQSGSTTASLYGLVSEAKVYDANQTTVLKRATTSYNLASAYLDRRIIGLPSESKLYDQSDILMSKVTYDYDGSNFSDTTLQQTIAPLQHDTTNYGASFIMGRGNLTSTTRHDVINSSTVSSSVKYNTAGAVVAQITPGSVVNTFRQVTISYADAFNDDVNTRNTYAYPTKVTDPANNFSEVKYRFDIGANVWAKSPAPHGNTYGKETTRDFDVHGRLVKESVWKHNQQSAYIYAYSRYAYPDNAIQSQVYSTVTDTNGNNIADTADEVLTETFTDGTGRVVRSRTPMSFNTNGGTTTWTGQVSEYNLLGQVKRSSVPTEVDANWSLAGDDATRGTWLWTHQKYDWKGRVVRKISTDGVDSPTLNDSDQIISYEGCGCAGGQVTTIQGEEVEPNKRRTQKIYSDILGREYKTEVLDWNGIVYQTTVNTYNARDQITRIRQYAGAEYNTTFQDTTFEFDGHGRLFKQHNPQQDTNKFTTYTYFDDDKPETITDARNAVKQYQYNNRGLIQQISWAVPSNSTIEVPTTVTFSYDNLGNRTQMNDGFGSVGYEYNELSQLTAETRQFNETVPNAPLTNNQFKIQYAYGLAGQLKSLTEPYGEIVTYGHDKTGRLKSVSGNRVNESVQLNYVTDAQYRAWGAVKRLDYGNSKYVEMNYNNRLQAENYTLANTGSSVINYQAYQYFADGRLKFSSPASNSNFDRSYEYDFLGRLTVAKTGAEARGQTESNPLNRPYRMTLEYNQFGDTINQERLHWRATFGSAFQFQNQKMTSETENRVIPGWQIQTVNTSYTHDADGRRIGDLQYNADGKVAYTARVEREAISGHDGDYYEWNGTAVKYDGDGGVVKTVQDGVRYYGSVVSAERRTFQIRSSVIGEVVTKLEKDWDSYSGYNSGIHQKERRYIYANGQQIAERRIYAGAMYPNSQDNTVLKISDASGVDKSETTLHGDGISTRSLSLDPYGADVQSSNAYPAPPPGGSPDPHDPSCVWNDYDDYDCDLPDEYEEENEDQQAGSIPENTCFVDDIETDCNDVAALHDRHGDEQKGAPSDEGPQSIHEAQHQKHQPAQEQKANVADFQATYTSMHVKVVDMNNPLSVEIRDSNFFVSTLDLRTETSLNNDDHVYVPPKIDKCLEPFGDLAAGLKSGLLNSLPSTGYHGGGNLITKNVSALEMLQNVARAETVNGNPDKTISAALLAHVWFGETSVGDFTASANVSQSKGKNSGNVDYGPFQLNYDQIKKEVGLGLYKIDDFSEKAVFGSKTTSPNTAFDGSPTANMTVAARKLLANGGIEDRNRVKAYVGETNWNATRRDQFDTYFRNWQSFFNCIK